MTHEDKINCYIEDNQHFSGFSFLDKILENFNFIFRVRNRSINRIPSEGRVVIIATHFIAFNVDADFADCIDGLILLSLEEIKSK